VHLHTPLDVPSPLLGASRGAGFLGSSSCWLLLRLTETINNISGDGSFDGDHQLPVGAASPGFSSSRLNMKINHMQNPD